MSRFETLVSRIGDRLAKVPHARKAEYDKLFVGDPRLLSDFYDYFRLSGAAYVVADNVTRQVQLLQDGVPESADMPKLSLPITKSKHGKPVIPDLADNALALDVVVNRVYQLQRELEVLPKVEDSTAFRKVPEFFQYNVVEGSDELYCDAGKLLFGILAWRWLLWLLIRYPGNRPIRDMDFDALWKGIVGTYPPDHALPIGTKYCDETFLRYRFLGLSDKTVVPEYALVKLDTTKTWTKLPADATAFSFWEALRRKLDSVDTNRPTFDVELQRFNRMLARKTLLMLGNSLDLSEAEAPLSLRSLDDRRDFTAKLHRTILTKYEDVGTIEDALAQLHNDIPAPLIAYYYHMFIDGSAKEHLVVPTFRSQEYPIPYVNRAGASVTQPGVAHCLVALNLARDGGPLLPERRKQLGFVLSLCGQPLIDAVFVRRLVDAHTEALSSKAELAHDIMDFIRLLGVNRESNPQADKSKHRLKMLGIMGYLHAGPSVEPSAEPHAIDLLGILESLREEVFIRLLARKNSWRGFANHLSDDNARNIRNYVLKLANGHRQSIELTVDKYKYATLCKSRWHIVATGMLYIALRQALYHATLFAFAHDQSVDDCFKVRVEDNSRVFIGNAAFVKPTFQKTADAKTLNDFSTRCSSVRSQDRCSWEAQWNNDNGILELVLNL